MRFYIILLMAILFFRSAQATVWQVDHLLLSDGKFSNAPPGTRFFDSRPDADPEFCTGQLTPDIRKIKNLMAKLSWIKKHRSSIVLKHEIKEISNLLINENELIGNIDGQKKNEIGYKIEVSPGKVNQKTLSVFVEISYLSGIASAAQIIKVQKSNEIELFPNDSIIISNLLCRPSSGEIRWETKRSSLIKTRLNSSFSDGSRYVILITPVSGNR